MPTLDELEQKFFEIGTDGGPIQRANTEVEFILDGASYFPKIYNAIQQTSGPDDKVYILGWRFDSDMDLTTRHSMPSSAPPIGKLLADLASRQIDVRIILNGNLVSFQFVYGVSPFIDNLLACEKLRELKQSGDPTPPLAGRVLFDWSGARTGSHHQKMVLVKAGTDLIAFIGGMDIWTNRWDESTHDKSKWHKDQSRWGWHDAAVKLRGMAVYDVMKVFLQRWAEASTLLPRTYEIFPDIGPAPPPGTNVKSFNPLPLVPAPPNLAPMPTFGVTSQSVQVMQSRFHSKYPTIIGHGAPWNGPPSGGIYQTYATLRKAIMAATQYIYVEDQFLGDSVNVSGAEGYTLLPYFQQAILRGVKLIFLSSGKSDPDDFPSASLKNQTLNEYVQSIGTMPPGVSLETRNNVVVWRVEYLTVHAKMMIIDDCFAAIGSANLHSRSMFGVDGELHVALVDTSTLIRDFRMNVWAEHLRIGPRPWPTSVEEGLRDLNKALKIWRPEWFPPVVPGLWRQTDNPPGFAPRESVLSLVGPDYIP